MIPKTATFPFGPAKYMQKLDKIQILEEVDGAMEFVKYDVEDLRMGDEYYKPILVEDFEVYKPHRNQ